ncbi:MAG TPA: PaaI family thioesterase [Burkholderiaceae bacterium]|nr:PaaI family thioesterase [Burkholderiaceae bacterium]
MKHPFAEHIAMTVAEQRSGYSRVTLQVAPHHLNPHGVVHGAVLFALADTGMGSALYPTLAAGESCATIEVKINYFKPVHHGTLSCETTIVHRGRSIANLESRVWLDGQVVASANGHYAIQRPRTAA